MFIDRFGQEIKDGDFVLSASKSSDSMIIAVIRDVKKQTRVRIFGDNESGWSTDHKVTRMHTLKRTLKIRDEMIKETQPDLYKLVELIRSRFGMTPRQIKTYTELTGELDKFFELP